MSPCGPDATARRPVIDAPTLGTRTIPVRATGWGYGETDTPELRNDAAAETGYGEARDAENPGCEERATVSRVLACHVFFVSCVRFGLYHHLTTAVRRRRGPLVWIPDGEAPP